ncbi:MAG TPA: RNA degradosome polyphosphate kinase, partial [Blastocatellia bacterium]|nr:RNA degradosome polyphosphate kinase [Blastocatellia bacterium]
RILCFSNGGDEEIYVGSADWMFRNLSGRVELVLPIDDPHVHRHIKEEVLEVYLRDNLKSRILRSDGSYTRLRPAEPEEGFNAQMHFADRQHLEAI